MEAMTVQENTQRTDSDQARPSRRALGGVVAAAVYVAMLLGAPFLVRYGPEPEVTAAVVQAETGSRCAQAPEFGRSCPSATPVTTVRGRFALFVP